MSIHRNKVIIKNHFGKPMKVRARFSKEINKDYLKLYGT